MATVVDLVHSGKLFRLDPVLGPRRQEFRVFFASHKLMTWMQEELPRLGSAWNIEQTPAEQLDAFFAVYASGETLTFDRQFRQLFPKQTFADEPTYRLHLPLAATGCTFVAAAKTLINLLKYKQILVTPANAGTQP